jgi:hypothetical protein
MLDIIAILYMLFDQSTKQKVSTKLYYTINDVLFDSVFSSAAIHAYSGFFSVCGDRRRNWGGGTLISVYLDDLTILCT